MKSSFFLLLTLVLSCASVNAQTSPAPSTATAPYIAPAPSTAPADQIPTAPTVAPGDTGPTAEEVARLRQDYDALKQREAAAALLSASVTAATQTKLTTAKARRQTLEASLPLEDWRATTLQYFLSQIGSVKQVPPEVPPGLVIAPEPAQVAAGTAMYRGPEPTPTTVVTTTAAPTPVLYLADAGLSSLIWTPEHSFAFVVTQFVEVFR